MFKKIVIPFLVILITLLITSSHSPLLSLLWDFTGKTLASRPGLVQPWPGQYSARQNIGEAIGRQNLELLRQGQYCVLTTTEAIQRAALMPDWAPAPAHQASLVYLIANPPGEFKGLARLECIKLLTAATKAAAKIGARIMIDASTADISRTDFRARQLYQLTRKLGIVRVVIFDGGHHLPSLALQPEIVIAPVLADSKNTLFVIHGQTLDPVRVSDLTKIIKKLHSLTLLTIMPRLSTPVKTKSPMGAIARQAIINSLTPEGYQRSTIKQRPIRPEFIAPAIMALNGTLLLSIPEGKFSDAAFSRRIKKYSSKYHELYVAVLYAKKTSPLRETDPNAPAPAAPALTMENGNYQVVTTKLSCYQLIIERALTHLNL